MKELESPLVRLNKLIADRGLASRRKADALIAEGRVIVNGKKIYELGSKVHPTKDRISIDGKPLKSQHEPVYIMFHKPKGVLTTMFDPLERPTVQDFVKHLSVRVFPIGRLDWDSEGLLLMTNDGDYAQKVMHPTEEVTKTYLVKLDKAPKPEALKKLMTGVPIVGGRVKARHVESVDRGKEKYPWYKVIIAEGKNRQIRQMFAKIGCDVLKLQRVAIGRLRLGQLPRGEMVFLNEVAAQRVFLMDEPDTVKRMKSYKVKPKPTGPDRRPVSTKRLAQMQG